MKVQIKDISSTKKEMQVTIPAEEVTRLSNEIYQDVARNAQVKGFRKGHAPRHVLAMYYGEYVEGELTKKLVNDNFEAAVEEQKLFVVSMPDVQNESPKDGEDFTFTATFDVKPEVTVKTCTGFELKTLKVEVGDDKVDEVIERLRDTYATVEDVEDETYAAVENDYVIVNVESEEKEDLKRNNMTVEAGNRSAFPGLEHAVIGMKKGESKEVELTFPEDHFIQDLQGSTAKATVSVESIRSRELPELDDEFAKKVRPEVESYAALCDEIREDIKKRMESETRTYLEQQVGKSLLEANEFEVPESMVQMQAAMMMKGYAERLAAQGMNLADLGDMEGMREEALASADKIVRTSLLIEAIAKDQDLKAGEEEINEKVEELAATYQVDAEMVRKSLEEQDSFSDLEFGVMEKKVYDYIIENSQVTEVEDVAELADEEEDADGSGADCSGTDE